MPISSSFYVTSINTLARNARLGLFYPRCTVFDSLFSGFLSISISTSSYGLFASGRSSMSSVYVLCPVRFRPINFSQNFNLSNRLCQANRLHQDKSQGIFLPMICTESYYAIWSLPIFLDPKVKFVKVLKLEREIHFHT